MYSEAAIRNARIWMWVLGVVGALLIVLWVANLIALINGRFSILTLLGIALIIPVTPLFSFFSYAWFKVRAGERITAVAELHPGAYLAQIVMSSRFVKQAKTLGTALDLDQPTVKRNSYGTFAATGDALLIYGGGANPVLRMSIPTSTLAYVRPGLYSNGVRTVPAIDLGFVAAHLPASDAPVPLQLVPLIQPGLFPKPLPTEVVPVELQRMQAATHPETVV